VSPARLDVVGIGSVAADRLHRVSRILGPDEKGVLQPMVGGAPVEVHVGGVVLNHIGWASALGLRAGIFGKQADDPNGRFLRAAMDRYGIEHHFVLDGSASTFADIYVDEAGGRAIYMAPGATSETTPDDIRRHHLDFIRSAAWVTTEVSQLPLATALEVVRIAKAAGAKTVVDLDVPPSDAVPGLGDEATLLELLAAADLLKPSKGAAAELAPAAGSDAGAVAEALRIRFGSEAVAVTDGAAGAAIATADELFRVPAAAPRTVVDTTGAGDAFLGGLLFARVRGLDWHAAGALANACGAACVERLGAFPEDTAAVLERVTHMHVGRAVELGRDPADAAAAGAAAAEAFGVLAEELAALGSRLVPETYAAVAALVLRAESAGARVHVTGIGKPEHVASYAASLLASTGTAATFLHGTEVIHGSAGQVQAGDVVVAISNSGETHELRSAVQAVRSRGAHLVAVTGNARSWLAQEADHVLDAGVAREGGPLGLAPRASVAAEVAVLAALAAELEARRGFSRADYHARHPAGELGKKSGS
jgi:sugar/nucleoside kinase (ribokinase family)/D-arabinose 5-phosphate isomerase GutQ